MSERDATLTSTAHGTTPSVLSSFRQHWFVWFTIGLGIWVLLPWLAPVLMHLGVPGLAHVIYFLYSPQCHQLPQRSYFLFGNQLMIPLKDILAAYPVGDPLQLRPFIGTPELGWKVACGIDPISWTQDYSAWLSG